MTGGVGRMAAAGVLAMAAALLGAGCGGEGETDKSAAPARVVIKDTAYNPPAVDVRTGGKVVWSFEDGDVDHTVTADDNSFGSDPNGMSSGTFEHVFSKAGTFAYHCDFHPVMTGKVTVR